MKISRNPLCSALALATLVTTGWAEKKDVVIRRLDGDAPHRLMVRSLDAKVEKEKVTCLGVETAPVSRTLASQLGLMRDAGLAVTHVLAGSPAADLVREDDVLTRLDDQILVNQSQLRVLIRSHREGDEVSLTLLRGGKETTVKVKLGTHEVPKMAGNFFFQHGGEPFNWAVPAPGEPGAPGHFPGMAPDEARDVLRMIGRERGRFVEGPGVRIRGHKGRELTIVDLPKSNISYSDDDGSIEIKSDEKERTLLVKDAQGKVTFEGPITTEEQRAKLSADVKQRLEVLDGDGISFEPDEAFKPELVPLPPAKTSISHEFEVEAEVTSEQPY